MATDRQRKEEREKHGVIAMMARVPIELAIQAFGKQPDMQNPAERSAFFATWSRLNFEYAETHVAEEVQRHG